MILPHRHVLSLAAVACVLLLRAPARPAAAGMGHDTLQSLRTPDGGFIRFTVKQKGAPVRGVLEIFIAPRQAKAWGKELSTNRFLDRSGAADTANVKPGKYRLRVRHRAKPGDRPVDALLGTPPGRAAEVTVAPRQVVRLQVNVP